MAEWVFPQEVRQELPSRGRGVTEAQLGTLIADGQDMTTLGDASAAVSTLGKRAVRAYARAEALKLMRNNGDPVSLEDIRLAEESADRFAAAYRMSTVTTSDDSASNYRGQVRATPW